MGPPVNVAAMALALPDALDFNATWEYMTNGLDLVLRTPGVGMSKQRYIGLVTYVQPLSSAAVNLPIQQSHSEFLHA